MIAFVVEAGQAREVVLSPGPQTLAVLRCACPALRALAHLVLLRGAA